MVNKIIFFTIWVVFIGYGFLLAPPDNPETMDLIINLSKGSWDGINPYVISLFNLMGILPMIYACLLLIDGRGQKLMVTPFMVGSFFLGAFSLLPYFALRESNTTFTGEKTIFIKIVESKLTAIALIIGTTILVVSAIKDGNVHDFIYQWQNSKFIHVMSLDFCLLCLLFPVLIKDDLARRNINNLILRAIAFIPLFGTLIYMILRPSLSTDETPNNSEVLAS
ncbi:hypothetical protein Cyast_0433 [Cyanobacterium stanieri PCC 7202]|uniref:DUF2834 domain-containing protein n=1 Tax=Cyanobacterium stanieri (strain ATCC 29140 / PCC 7202) TaxID=292563 RepID=K9YJX2_CYASC|nr:hypothetical protein Cyast_0433 [Cyanobacterium stanieri PCC 7202]